MNKIFLRTREHKGAYYLDHEGIRHLGELFLNLLTVERIFFDAYCSEENIVHSITFCMAPISELQLPLEFSLCFTTDGMGEFHRYKREIEGVSVGSARASQFSEI